MTTNEPEPTWAIQTLIHTYLFQPATPSYISTNIDITFPIWTENWDGPTATIQGSNDGSLLLNVMKIIIKS